MLNLTIDPVFQYLISFVILSFFLLIAFSSHSEKLNAQVVFAHIKDEKWCPQLWLLEVLNLILMFQEVHMKKAFYKHEEGEPLECSVYCLMPVCCMSATSVVYQFVSKASPINSCQIELWISQWSYFRIWKLSDDYCICFH